MMNHPRQGAMPFDPMLLTIKLEAHQRDLEAEHLTRKEKHQSSTSASSRWSHGYIPRSAAKQFTATTTSTSMAPPPTEQTNSGNRPPHIDQRQLHVALRMGLSESEALASAYHPAPPRRDSQGSQNSQGHKADSVTGHSSPPMDSYKPGDAQRRRASKALSTSYQAAQHHSELDEDAIPAHRLSRDQQNEWPHSLPGFGAQTHSRQQQQRRTPRDRPNWTQESRVTSGSGEDFRHRFHLPLRQKKDEGACDDTLVNDAVRLLKGQKKRLVTQKSIAGFFKRLEL